MSNHPDQPKLDWNTTKNQSLDNMKLRDFFIGAALTGLLSTHKHGESLGSIAEESIYLANEVLKARGKL